MTRFPGHAPLDLQAGSKMVACSSRWSSRAIHFKMVARDSRRSASDIYSVVYSSTNAFVTGPERFTASGVSKIGQDIYCERVCEMVARKSGRPGHALLQAGMRDGRLYFPTPSDLLMPFFVPRLTPGTGLPLFEFWFKFPFHRFHQEGRCKNRSRWSQSDEDGWKSFEKQERRKGKRERRGKNNSLTRTLDTQPIHLWPARNLVSPAEEARDVRL
ncbi:hypothetical protein B0H14DRAFT_3642565 [Mycena olivaceomarginata]|nr:hypothetical protein B0H14DRAFT_3642565 [Mycena olivaceomarginata]